MKAYSSLPEGYKKILHINLQKDQTVALKINIGAVIAIIVLFFIGKQIMPGVNVLDMGFFKGIIFVISFLVYMVLHELTHAVVMKAVGGGKVVFGFTGLYAFVGSKEDYFDKISYRLIALAPLVVWGIILGIPSPKGSGTWSKKTISTILTNAKYTGNVQVLKSNPGRNSYCMWDAHEAIVSMEDFEQVQKEIERRTKKKRKYESAASALVKEINWKEPINSTGPAESGQEDHEINWPEPEGL